MPRKKPRYELSSHYVENIERQANLFDRTITDATLNLAQFCPHGEALCNLRKELRVAMNIINNLPADYHRPNMHMTPEQLAWHMEVEREARASRDNEDD